jgi:hypothetical protein
MDNLSSKKKSDLVIEERHVTPMVTPMIQLSKATKGFKPVPASTLVRRKKRLVNLIKRLELLEQCSDYQERERSRLGRLERIAEERRLIQLSKTHTKQAAESTAMTAISHLYDTCRESFFDNRTWWQKYKNPVRDFCYSLPYPSSSRINSTTEFCPSGKGHGESFGKFLQTQETWEQVVEIERQYFDEIAAIDEDVNAKLKLLESEEKSLLPEKINFKRVEDLPTLREQLSLCEHQLALMELDEESVRAAYAVDDITIAKAAAYGKKTRDLAQKLRPALRTQLDQSALCPYCSESLSSIPHADHIVPVSLGGLSTLDNLVFVCFLCNSKKSDLTLREFCEKYSLDRELIERKLISLGKRV